MGIARPSLCFRFTFRFSRPLPPLPALLKPHKYFTFTVFCSSYYFGTKIKQSCFCEFFSVCFIIFPTQLHSPDSLTEPTQAPTFSLTLEQRNASHPPHTKASLMHTPALSLHHLPVQTQSHPGIHSTNASLTHSLEVCSHMK